MGDLTAVVGVALGGSLAVAAPGALVLYGMRRRSVTAHVCVLLAVAVGAVSAGIVGAALAMFISRHDLTVLLIVVGVAGGVSLAVALPLGRRFASASIWVSEARDRERRLEASRRELVAWVSHDLRTPLAGLRAMAEALEDGVVDDRATVAVYHGRIRHECDRMAELVDDLFELSRINAGALRLQHAAVSLGDVVNDAVASAAPLANARRIRLAAAEGSWPTVRGSEPELNRVVTNLLLNAIRHTPPDGSVSIAGGSDDWCGWLAVTDACGGIPEADLPRVFDVAFRGAAARTPDDAASGTGGGATDLGPGRLSTPPRHGVAGSCSRDVSPHGNGGGGIPLQRPKGDGAYDVLPRGVGAGGGLGLAIVRGLVEAHHGEVAVSNTDGGCRFLVRLPAD